MDISIPDLLSKNRVVLDDLPHISIDQEAARLTGTGDRIIACCPAGVYSRSEDGDILIEHAACLECGTCLAVATPAVLKWHYPRGGFGVSFRQG